MRMRVLIICFLVIVYPISGAAVTGVSVGAKVGYANYTGDILPSSGDVGGSLMYGAVIEIATLPVVDFEIHANYFTKDFTYSYTVAGNSASTTFEFQDLNVLALAKKNLITVPASPIGLYLGGGVGWHLINTEIAQRGNFDPSSADDPFALFENTSKMSANGLVGLKLSAPVVPFAIYGEGRFGRIFTDEPLTSTEIEAGLLLKF